MMKYFLSLLLFVLPVSIHAQLFHLTGNTHCNDYDGLPIYLYQL